MPQKESTLTYRWFAEVWNLGMENSIDELLGPEAVVHGIDGLSEPGPAGFKVFYHSFLNALQTCMLMLKTSSPKGDLNRPVAM